MPKPKRAAPPPEGTVFLYPYLWDWQERRGISESKDRTCCLAFVLRRPKGRAGLIVLPISDKKPDNPQEAIEVPLAEKRKSGLERTRLAFVHITEYNYDTFPDSAYMPPATTHLGKFSDEFTRQIIAAMRELLKQKRVKQIDRMD